MKQQKEMKKNVNRIS